MKGLLNTFVSKDIDIVSLDECYSRITSKTKVKRFVTYTFDDGYEDNLTNALPIFEKYNTPFSIFLTTNFPNHKIVLWWYLLETLIVNSDKVEFVDANRKFFYNTLSRDKKEVAYRDIRRFIMQSTQEELLPRLKNIFNLDIVSLFSLTEKLALSWEQVVELSNHSLVTIGSHTVNHFALRELSKEEVITEIINANDIIEKKIRKPVSFLAYPFGIPSTIGEREFKIADQSKMRMAFTAESSNIFRHHAEELYSIPRIEINELWSVQDFDFYLNGFIPFLHKFTR